MLQVFPVLYLVAVMAVGLSYRRRMTDEATFFLARRSGNVLMLTGSLLATILGSFGVLGISGLAYRMGFVAGWYLWGGVVGLAVLGFWGIGRLKITDVYTLPELLGRTYGRPVRVISAALIVFAWLSIVAAQLIAAGKIVHFLGEASGWQIAAWGVRPFVAGVAVVFIAYTCLGGQHSILRTDLFQAVLLVAALAALLAAGFARPEPLAAVDPALMRFPFSDSMTPMKWLALMLTFGVPFLVGPDIYSRLFSGRSASTGRISVLLAAGLMIPIVLAVVLGGMLARGILGGGATDCDTILLQSASLILSPIWGGLLVAALLAAVMSSADTCLLTISTLVSRDLLGALNLRRGEGASIVVQARWIVLVAGLASLAVALYNPSIVKALMVCYKLYSPAVLCPFLAILLWPGRKFPAWTGAAAVLLGGGTAGLGLILQSEALQLAAFGVSALPIAAGLPWSALQKPNVTQST